MPHVIGGHSVLSIREAMQIFGLSHTYLGHLLRKGMIDGIKIDSMWLIYEDSLRTYLTKPRKPGPKARQK